MSASYLTRVLSLFPAPFSKMLFASTNKSREILKQAFRLETKKLKRQSKSQTSSEDQMFLQYSSDARALVVPCAM